MYQKQTVLPPWEAAICFRHVNPKHNRSQFSLIFLPVPIAKPSAIKWLIATVCLFEGNSVRIKRGRLSTIGKAS
jgi:hypothetical protein